jgi:dGTPase
VFVTPDSDHVVTRMTHTIEVQQIARTIARALNLNEDLTEAIAMGHDLGHTPFGHAGEEELGRLLPDGFRHNEQSLRIVEHLENAGQGLNLMFETRDGILRHSKGRASVTSEEGWGMPATLEGEIVKLSDSIAYLNHDIQDAIRAGLIGETDLPSVARTVLGGDHSSRVDTLVTDCVVASLATFDGERPTIVLGAATLEATDALRDFMFERVYHHERTLEGAARGQAVVSALFRYYEGHPEEVSGWSLPDDPAWRRAADYVSGMTDHYALKRAHELGLVD